MLQDERMWFILFQSRISYPNTSSCDLKDFHMNSCNWQVWNKSSMPMVFKSKVYKRNSEKKKRCAYMIFTVVHVTVTVTPKDHEVWFFCLSHE